jgi:hypothetical protein
MSLSVSSFSRPSARHKTPAKNRHTDPNPANKASFDSISCGLAPVRRIADDRRARRATTTLQRLGQDVSPPPSRALSTLALQQISPTLKGTAANDERVNGWWWRRGRTGLQRGGGGRAGTDGKSQPLCPLSPIL